MTAIRLDRFAIRKIKPGFDLLVNTTPVGMWPEVGNSAWPEGTPLLRGAVVYDLVYNPPETALVRAARQAGLFATTGLGMLVEQAALALERWTGKPAPRRPMWEAVKEFHDSCTAWDSSDEELK